MNNEQIQKGDWIKVIRISSDCPFEDKTYSQVFLNRVFKVCSFDLNDSNNLYSEYNFYRCLLMHPDFTGERSYITFMGDEIVKVVGLVELWKDFVNYRERWLS